MNLYLRLLWTMWRASYLPKLQIGDWIERRLRVLPNDLDINLHMNNGRYLTVVDLLLMEYFVRSGFARTMLRLRWRPMLGGAVITYRRGLQPFQSYRLRFAIIAADDHWNYMRFEFLREDGSLCAAGLTKGAVVGRNGLVSNVESYAQMGLEFIAAPLPPAVQHWLDAERCIVDDVV